MLRALADLLAPPVCLACRVAGADLCGECRRGLPWLAGPLCRRCALPAPCGPCCPASGAGFEWAWAAVAYGGPARGLVLALKERRRLVAAELMAAQIVAGAPPGLLGGDARASPGSLGGEGIVLVPVPGHPARASRRGFDQAERLCAALSRRTGVPVRVCLRRGRAGTRQVGADRATRLAAAAVDVRARGRSPVRALLVDDVHTTGATLRACASALRAGGSEWVGAVTYARTLRDGA